LFTFLKTKVREVFGIVCYSIANPTNFAKFLEKSPNFQYYKIENPKKPRIAIKENGTWTYTHYVNLIGAFIL
jgi:hypothetical protein